MVATGKDTVRTDRQRKAAAERASLLKILPLIPSCSRRFTHGYRIDVQNRQMLLGEHLVFMFQNAGTLLITMFASILPCFHEFAGSLALLMLTVMTYQLLAMKGFYRGRWLQLLVRYFTFVAIYGISFLRLSHSLLESICFANSKTKDQYFRAFKKAFDKITIAHYNFLSLFPDSSVGRATDC